MFTGIKIKNYKSLKKLDVDLSSKKNVAKPLVLIYGENGVGKSNFASVFFTLCESLRTMSIKNTIQQFVDKHDNIEKVDSIEFEKFLFRNFRDTEGIIRNCKSINSKENMVLEFDFVLDGKRGNYHLEYNESNIVHEKLDYALNKNKTNVYNIMDKEININDNVFNDKEYAKEFLDLLQKYNGKHSFLSILAFEIDDKAEEYVQSRISEGLYEVFGFFMTMSIRVKAGRHGEKRKMGICHEILGDLDKGQINISEEAELDRAENMINEFFTLAYSDIKEAYYKKEIVEEQIRYNLFFKKLIYGEIVDVDFELESTGTQNLLGILPYLLMSVEGRTVVIDELDTGIHDLLINNILTNIVDSIRGQLIITTHNTMLLDSEIDPNFIYTFMVDKNAEKSLLPIIQYEDRVHPNLNYRSRYLKGLYGGVPISCGIDFDELWEFME